MSKTTLWSPATLTLLALLSSNCVGGEKNAVDNAFNRAEGTVEKVGKYAIIAVSIFSGALVLATVVCIAGAVVCCACGWCHCQFGKRQAAAVPYGEPERKMTENQVPTKFNKGHSKEVMTN